ncbi:MAG TPA: hypothetical protein EYQ00_11230 [Dehalococcoidia bacterium]|nr:hypothetical protein [Dehalococcoidia bacterium]
MGIKKGDLIRFKTTGRFATVSSNIYTHRWLDRDDDALMSAGMGYLAGSYCGTFNVIMMDNGRSRRIRQTQPLTFDVIQNIEVAE